ncbi:hypothetical protein D3H65_29705 [Paraflavitalea soli]|uniref:Uncharacterized protein n=1 Tax=Paraflavitalea soli TaxID=2315862 RepID=A0A3B7MWS5_9BACT|nr:hypothetical protein [Paraflavitalea soli]AXY77913.1 hypothetical protein D3H65_29705 [Paraflavitalea soli]
MKQSIIHKIYLNWKYSSVRTQLCTLALLFVLFCSFTSVNLPQPQDIDHTDWLHHSTDATDQLALSHNGADPNNDLHLTARKQIKVKCIKKSSPNPFAAHRSTGTGDNDHLSIAGLATVIRPAYYTFLFRYTLF